VVRPKRVASQLREYGGANTGHHKWTAGTAIRARLGALAVSVPQCAASMTTTFVELLLRSKKGKSELRVCAFAFAPVSAHSMGDCDVTSRNQRSRTPSDTSKQRVEQIRTLTLKLHDATVLNTQVSRARCYGLIVKIAELLANEDAYQRALGRSPEPTADAIRRRADAIADSRAAGEQAELTRLFVKSQQLERGGDRKRSR